MTDPGGFESGRVARGAKSEELFTGFEIDGVVGPIRGEVVRARNPEGAVVICHGFKGFAHWGFFPHLARKIADAGLNAVTFDFSGSGIGADRETGSEAEKFERNTVSAELADLDRVIASARAQGVIGGEKFGLFGHSRGGGIAILHAGSDQSVGALVTWNSISFVKRWTEEDAKAWRVRGYSEIANTRTGQVYRMGTALLDDVESNSEKLDIEAAASRIKAPWLILHGKADETVPPAEAERLGAASKGNATLRLVEGNHGFDAKHPLVDVPPNLASAVSETVSFFTQHLGG